jgi:HAD hydrolase, family IA, variant 1
MRVVRGLEPLPFETLRKTASSGARGLLGAAFGIRPEDAGYAEMAKEFLDYYEEHMADHSRLFDGVPEMLQDIEAQGARWGIITNKHARFVHPLIKFHMLEPAVVVCGDTLKVSKPNPEPIRFALKSINAKASEAIYAGDDKRDIDAANGADVFSVAVQWGYLGSPQPVQDWCADLIVHNPSEILGIELTK